MVLIFIAVAASLLSVAIIYATYTESKRIDAIERETRCLLQDMKDTRVRAEKTKEQLEELFTKFLESHGLIGKRFDTLTKEFEVMSIRQRTLEKRIIEANRTVHLVFGKPIPMQVESIPHTIIKEKKGRGKAALFHHSV